MGHQSEPGLLAAGYRMAAVMHWPKVRIASMRFCEWGCGGGVVAWSGQQPGRDLRQAELNWMQRLRGFEANAA